MAQGYYSQPQQQHQHQHQHQHQQHFLQQPLANGRPVYASQPAPPPLLPQQQQQQSHQLRHSAASQPPPLSPHQVQAGGIAAYLSDDMLQSFVIKWMAYKVFSDTASTMLKVPFQQQQSWQQQELLQQSQQPQQVLYDSMFHHPASQGVHNISAAHGHHSSRIAAPQLRGKAGGLPAPCGVPHAK